MRTTALCLILLAAPGAAVAADDVSSTKHNLSTAGTGTYKLASAPGGDANKDQVCMFCHTPHHGASSVGVVLWNRDVNTAGYTMYDSATVDMTIAAQPQGVSMACLSCHDGQIAFDALLNGPGSGDYDPTGTARGWTWTAGVSRIPASAASYLSQDLSDDHPVSVTYDNSATGDTAFIDQSTVEAVSGLRFYYDPAATATDQLECGTCHNPHDATNEPFLRMSNAASALCVACHVK